MSDNKKSDGGKAPNLSKEELMRQVLGKNRRIDVSGEALDVMRERSEQISKELEEMTKRANASDSDELLKTLMHNQKQMEELSEEVDLSDLKARIAQDFGVAAQSAEDPSELSALGFNYPSQTAAQDQSRPRWKDIPATDIRANFDALVSEISRDVVGQQGAIEDMAEGVLRPYVLDTRVSGDDREFNKKLRNTVFVGGTRGSGRHFLVKKTIEAIDKTMLPDADATWIDMAEYQENSKESMFLQDMYSALNGSSEIIVIENFERAHIAIIGMLGELISSGKISLPKRYVPKGGVLQETEKTLQKDYLREIYGNDKLLILISGKNSLVNTFGKSVADSVLDIAMTKPLSRDDAGIIVSRKLDELRLELEKVMRAKVSIDPSVKEALLSKYESFNGVYSFLGAITEIRGKLLDQAVSRLGSDVKLNYDGSFVAEYLGETLSLGSKNTELEEVKKEIEEIVGLTEVKEYLYSLEDLVKAGTERRRMGLKSDAVTRHMIFTGNPGTGKTTIARLVSRLMKAIGALEQGHLVEVTRADMVGRYVGHTAPLTMSVIKSALGGVLFIDEAYSLYRGRDDSFGLEAIDALVKGMEDNRDSFMVILAGYSKEMSVFLTANSGLSSRFPKTINFADYTAEELYKIAVVTAKKKDYIVDPAVEKALTAYLGKRNEVEKSNGRLARNVVEAAIIKQSGRVLGQTDPTEMRTLRLEDFRLE